MQQPVHVPPTAPARLVVLASGTGSLLESVLAAAVGEYPARVVAVGTDRECRALEVGAAAGAATFTTQLRDHADRAAWDVALTEAVAAHEPDLVVSAGFMKILGPAFLGRFGGREAEVMRAGTFTRPSFEPDAAAVWAVADGTRILRTVQSAATAAQFGVDAPAVASDCGGAARGRARPSRCGRRSPPSRSETAPDRRETC